MDADANANANANANADAGGSTIALRERCSGELKMHAEFFFLNMVITFCLQNFLQYRFYIT